MIRTQEATGKTVDEARANACAKLGVKPDLQSPVALLLQLMGPFHPRADLSRGFSFLLLLQILIAHRRHIDADIYAIQQRLGQLAKIPSHVLLGAFTAVPIGIITAGTGIHGRHQHEIRRKGVGARRPTDTDPLLLQRLTQYLQGCPAKFR